MLKRRRKKERKSKKGSMYCMMGMTRSFPKIHIKVVFANECSKAQQLRV
jgi:hypothetical protein